MHGKGLNVSQIYEFDVKVQPILNQPYYLSKIEDAY